MVQVSEKSHDLIWLVRGKVSESVTITFTCTSLGSKEHGGKFDGSEDQQPGLDSASFSIYHVSTFSHLSHYPTLPGT